jgi:hypothetical protein
VAQLPLAKVGNSLEKRFFAWQWPGLNLDEQAALLNC